MARLTGALDAGTMDMAEAANKELFQMVAGAFMAWQGMVMRGAVGAGAKRPLLLRLMSSAAFALGYLSGRAAMGDEGAALALEKVDA